MYTELQSVSKFELVYVWNKHWNSTRKCELWIGGRPSADNRGRPAADRSFWVAAAIFQQTNIIVCARAFKLCCFQSFKKVLAKILDFALLP